MEKRVIKFRAWDKFGKIMKDDGASSEGKPHMKYDVGVMPAFARNTWATGVDGLEIRVDCKDFDLMQFTGLKDKNGKEIYEGDVVSWIYEWESYEPDGDGYETNIAVCKGEVSFVSGKWDVKGEIGGLYKADTKTLEVIGNIYENPELLKP